MLNLYKFMGPIFTVVEPPGRPVHVPALSFLALHNTRKVLFLLKYV